MSGAQRTTKAYETWIKETKASGAQDMKEQVGPWAMARNYHFGANMQMLIEDHGVMIYFDSNALDDAALVDYAKIVAVAFRAPSDIKESASALGKH